MIIKCRYQGKNLDTGERICCGRKICIYDGSEKDCPYYEADDRWCKTCTKYQDGECSDYGCSYVRKDLINDKQRNDK